MRVSTAVMACSCLLIGFALAGTGVNAREDVSPARRFPAGVGVGTHVRLVFPGGDRDQLVDCTIAAVDGGWIRCATPADPFRKNPGELWYDVGHVSSVTKLEDQR